MSSSGTRSGTSWSVPAASDQLSASLSEACTKVRQLFSRNDARDALDRYAIGCVIRDVRDAEDKYGQHSVGKIARAVGRDVDTLYEYADVAETWSEIEIGRLVERKTPLGVPLSFTHLVVLSKVRRNRDLLKVMTDRAMTGISARHLREALVEERRRVGSNARSNGAPSRQLKQILTCCDRLLALSSSLEECLSELELNPELVTDSLEMLLGQVKTAYEKVSLACRANVLRVQDSRESSCRDLLSDDSAEASRPDGLGMLRGSGVGTNTAANMD